MVSLELKEQLDRIEKQLDQIETKLDVLIPIPEPPRKPIRICESTRFFSEDRKTVRCEMQEGHNTEHHINYQYGIRRWENPEYVKQSALKFI